MFLGIVLRDPPSAMKTLKATSRKIKKDFNRILKFILLCYEPNYYYLYYSILTKVCPLFLGQTTKPFTNIYLDALNSQPHLCKSCLFTREIFCHHQRLTNAGISDSLSLFLRSFVSDGTIFKGP